MVVEINLLEFFLVGIFYLVTVIFTVNLMRYMRKSILYYKLKKFLRVNSALLSLIYKTNGSFYQTLKTISENKELLGPLSAMLTRYGIKYILSEIEENGDYDESILDQLQDILVDPDKFVKKIEDNLKLLNVELELSNQYLTTLDEKISILLFTDYFVPFIILFISILNSNFLKIFIILLPLFSIFSIFFTYKVIDQ